MSRHGYNEDLDQQDLAMWRGRVASAIRGKRGQRLLRELRDALDAMPTKELVSTVLVDEQGGCCTLGAACLARKLPNIDDLDPEDHDGLGSIFDVAACMIQEIEYMNDEGVYHSDPAKRWEYMRRWVEKNITPATGAKP